MTTEIVGKKILKLMDERDISESQLAKLTNVTQSTLNRILSGKTKQPRRQLIRDIADFFGLSPDELLENATSEEAASNQVRLIRTLNDDITVPEIFVKTNYSPSNEAYAVLVNDDSYEPVFYQNSVLIIEPKKKRYNKCFAAIIVQDEQFEIVRLIEEQNKLFKVHLKKGKLRKNRSPVKDESEIHGIVAEIQNQF